MRALWWQRLVRTLGSILLVLVLTLLIWSAHAKSFAAGFIYLFPVMFLAFRWGIAEATVASVVSVACLDYFFTEPLFHWYMSDPQDWIALSCFEAVVLLVSQFADRLKRHAESADHRREQIEKLYRMSANILLLDCRDAVGLQTVRLVREIFDLQGVSLWDARNGRLDQVGPPAIPGNEAGADALHLADKNTTKEGQFIRQMLVGNRSVGVVGLACLPERITVDHSTADAIASLAALALERAYAFKAESDAEASKQVEQFRSAVLDGLAHSFKTPLATVQTASSGLLEMGALSPAQCELVTLIDQETVRLTQLTNEALQTADLNEEYLRISKETFRVEPFLYAILDEHQERYPDHPLSVVSKAGETVTCADRRLMRMAIGELLDNAAKYSAPGSSISFEASQSDSEVVLAVRNAGSYIEAEDRMRIFRRYYRAPGAHHQAPGTGIGLSFVRRIVEAHHGRVWVQSDHDSGTAIFIGLPHPLKEA
jgi:two-component system sensor histidine kinase KdpD